MAELQERGIRVSAEEEALPALRRVTIEGLSPKAVLWDCKLGSPDEKVIESFRGLIPGLRFLFLQTVGCEISQDLLSPLDRVERRPVSVGELAEDLVRILHES